MKKVSWNGSHDMLHIQMEIVTEAHDDLVILRLYQKLPDEPNLSLNQFNYFKKKINLRGH